MTPDEALALVRSLPIYSVPVAIAQRDLSGYGFDWEKQQDGTALLLYRSLDDITPMHVVTDYSRAVFDRYGSRAEWAAFADRALWGINSSYSDPYGEAFGASCAVLFSGGPVPLLSFFKTQELADEVRVFALSLIPKETDTPVSPTDTAAEWHGPLPGSNWMPGRDGSLIDRIVLHHMAGTAAGAEARFRKVNEQVSAHFGILRDGRVWQWVSTGDTAYHAGEWYMNLRSIGIEHEDNGSDDFTDADYAASAALVRDLCSTHGIPLDREHVIGHREVVATACPGALDIDRILREAGGDMADYVSKEEFAAYQQNVKETIEAMKQQYDPLVNHEHKTGKPEAA